MERKTHLPNFYFAKTLMTRWNVKCTRFLAKKEKNGEMERKTHSPKPKAKKRKDVVKWSVKRIHNQFLFSSKKFLIISLNALLLSHAHWISKSYMFGL